MGETRKRLERFGFWVLLVNGLVMNFAKPPLRTLSGVIFLTALLSQPIEATLKTLLRIARWISRSLAG